jgi:hypothetical protein
MHCPNCNTELGNYHFCIGEQKRKLKNTGFADYDELINYLGVDEMSLNNLYSLMSKLGYKGRTGTSSN